MDKNKEHWEKYYKSGVASEEPSSFAQRVAPLVRGALVDLGCGNGRDTRYFEGQGIEAVGVDEAAGMSVEEFIEKIDSPENVYARFFWHSITREVQNRILEWTTGTIFIEARTTEDEKRPKVAEPHWRNYVDVVLLVIDLKRHGFEIISLEEGTGFSPYKGEDPHLVRVIAKKK